MFKSFLLSGTSQNHYLLPGKIFVRDIYEDKKSEFIFVSSNTDAQMKPHIKANLLIHFVLSLFKTVFIFLDS